MRPSGLWFIAGVAFVALALAGLVWATWPVSPPPPDWSADYDLSARYPGEIAPGTVVEQSAPAGWSHLIIKSLPRVRADHAKDLPGITVRNASWMFTAFTADVVPESADGRSRHRLRAIGLGLGAKVNGKDTILTAETGDRFGADLGWIGREILTKGYDIQRKAVLVVHGPTFGLIDTPVWFRCGDDNRLVRYRYALLVDPAADRRLDVLMWSIGAEGAECRAMEDLVRIEADTIDPAELVVDRRKVNRLGIPSDDAFAVEVLPPGPRRPFPPNLRPLAGQTRFSASEARLLETELRSHLAP